MNANSSSLAVLLAGDGIASAFALARRSLAGKVPEQAPQFGEIGSGVQFGPNAFAALDALGIGDIACGRAVDTDEMVMHGAINERCVGRIPIGTLGEALRIADDDLDKAFCAVPKNRA